MIHNNRELSFGDSDQTKLINQKSVKMSMPTIIAA